MMNGKYVITTELLTDCSLDIKHSLFTKTLDISSIALWTHNEVCKVNGETVASFTRL